MIVNHFTDKTYKAIIKVNSKSTIDTNTSSSVDYNTVTESSITDSSIDDGSYYLKRKAADEVPTFHAGLSRTDGLQSAKRRQSNYSQTITQMFRNLEYQEDLAIYKDSLLNNVSFLKAVTVYMQHAITLFWEVTETEKGHKTFEQLLDEEEDFMKLAFNQ
jgi:hypothetical protein